MGAHSFNFFLNFFHNWGVSGTNFASLTNIFQQEDFRKISDS